MLSSHDEVELALLREGSSEAVIIHWTSKAYEVQPAICGMSRDYRNRVMDLFYGLNGNQGAVNCPACRRILDAR